MLLRNIDGEVEAAMLDLLAQSLSESSSESFSSGLYQSADMATPMGTLYSSAFMLMFSFASYLAVLDSFSRAIFSCMKRASMTAFSSYSI